MKRTLLLVSCCPVYILTNTVQELDRVFFAVLEVMRQSNPKKIGAREVTTKRTILQCK
jgi:hypothetical protein